MQGTIPREFIAQLLSKSDIKRLFESRGIALKKSGRTEFVCRCPFHNEKTPSCHVYPDEQRYYCYGCHAKGDSIDFLKEFDKLSFVDAVELLAEEAGVDIPRVDSPEGAAQTKRATPGAYAKLKAAAELYSNELQGPEGQAARAYLSGRGITEETIKKFGIGFAPDSFDFLIKHLGKTAQDIEELEEAGLIIARENSSGHYDRFRGRVMIPIVDRRSRVMAFGGRVLTDEKPKYLNSPETAVFHKGKELFGLVNAIESSRKNKQELKELVIVEGYMDVIALAQSGFSEAVASLGTATTPEQMKLMLNYAPRIICCYDGDAAGRKAAWAALKTALPVISDEKEIFFSFLPPEHDPDTFVREQGPDAFRKYLAEAQNLEEFMFSHLISHMNNKGNMAELAKNAEELISLVPQSSYRKEALVARAARETGFSHEMIAQRVGIFATKKMAANDRSAQKLTINEEDNLIHVTTKDGRRLDLELTPIRKALAIAVHFPEVAVNALTREKIASYLDLFEKLNMKVKGTDLLVTIMELIAKAKSQIPHAINASAFARYCAGSQIEPWINALMAVDVYPIGYTPTPKEAANDLVTQLFKLSRDFIDSESARLQAVTRTRSLSSEENQYMHLLLAARKNNYADKPF